GLALRHGITCLNAPGTIDSDYRGPVCVLLVNLSLASYTIKRGDRIAQLIVAAVERARFHAVEALDETTRASGGFGSTGLDAVQP
ncbi:MAG: dUTP diphosphatase, partial [Candidatus Eremiobacteraeota bacterium]|nr:dUTP diphosphatase [Candidatus Eremiobacteraeota bacterium]